MKIVALPKELVAILDALHSGEELDSDDIERWNEFLEDWDSLVSRMEFLASEERAVDLSGSARSFLDELASLALEPEVALQIQENCFLLYSRMYTYSEWRSQMRYTKLPEVDHLLHALQAYRMARVSPEGLQTFANAALAETDRLVGIFKGSASELPEDVQQAILRGIESCNVGFSLLENLPECDVKQVMANLRNGAIILENLRDWEETTQLEGASAIPMVGQFVDQMLQEYAESGEISEDTVQHWCAESIWDLQDVWKEARHDFFMSRERKDQYVTSIDSLVSELSELSSFSPDTQAQLLSALKDNFESLSQEGFESQLLRSHSDAWLPELFIAALAGGIPTKQLSTTASEIEDSHQYYAQLIRSYLDTKDRDYLLDALSQIAREAEEQRFSRSLGKSPYKSLH